MNRREEVRIRIRSVRYEVEESLFSKDNDEMIAEDTLRVEPETIEISSIGRLTLNDGRVEIAYDETEITGMDGSTTAISLTPSANRLVIRLPSS